MPTVNRTPSSRSGNDIQPVRQPGLLRRLAGYVKQGTNDLYKSVYYNDPTDRQQLQQITKDINSTIRDIMSTTSDEVGEPNITKLYERLLSNGSVGSTSPSGKKLDREFERIFGSNEFTAQITGSYLANRWVKTIDMEIDEILRYMPKLAEALSVVTDNVLSADSFNKDYLSLTNDIDDTTTSAEQFSKNIEDLKEKYDLSKLTKDIYNQTSRYGETFCYVVPYTKAIQRLMDRREYTKNLGIKADESGMIIESAEDGTQRIPYAESVNDKNSMTFENGDFSCHVTIEDGIISSVVETAKDIHEKRQKLNEQSLLHEGRIDRIDIDSSSKAYALDDTINREPEALRGRVPKHKRFDRTIGDTLELPDLDDTSADGLYDRNARGGQIKDINGCIVKILKRERVVPIILQNVCLGYYYFEFDSTMEMFDERLSSTGLVNTLTGIRSNHRMEAFDSLQRREEMLRNISAELAKKIDVKFIDANQDLKKEIYYILKYNDDFTASIGGANNIRISYIPPEDIKHFYFELDEDTGRGISDLNMSLIPAKLWVAITLCNCVGIMTRGNDKRVIYVRQSVESNINKILMKTINEIKRGNFNIRQIENINSVLNITGRFNDYIIPRSADGQSPVEFEVMQGQNIEIKTDLLTLLEESAINQLVPIEIIQSRQSPDYAMQLTMQNSKFLRFVYDRQANYQAQVSKLVTDIYNIEYGTRDKIKLKLPPPLFINVNNTNQLVQNTLDYCRNIVEVTAPDEEDDVKQKIIKKLASHFLGSYLDIDLVNDMIDRAKQDKALDAIKQDAENGGEGNDMGMGDMSGGSMGTDMGSGEDMGNMDMGMPGGDFGSMPGGNMGGSPEGMEPVQLNGPGTQPTEDEMNGQLAGQPNPNQQQNQKRPEEQNQNNQ